MWIGARRELGDLRDFRAATLTAAVTKARATAEEFYSRNAAGPAAELLLWIFGRRLPVFNKGPQLVVTGEPGQFTATDARDDSVLHGATLEDLLAAAAVNRAQPADYAISWSIALVTAATEATSGRRRSLADGVLHAHGLGCLRDHESRPPSRDERCR
jgi:hypothetical protein